MLCVAYIHSVTDMYIHVRVMYIHVYVCGCARSGRGGHVVTVTCSS